MRLSSRPCEWSRTLLAAVCRDGQLNPAPSSRVYFFAAFFFAAHRAFAAAEILARPSGERVRFAFFAAFAGLAAAFTTFTAPAGRPLFFAAADDAPASSARASSSRTISASISEIKLPMLMVLFSRSSI